MSVDADFEASLPPPWVTFATSAIGDPVAGQGVLFISVPPAISATSAPSGDDTGA